MRLAHIRRRIVRRHATAIGDTVIDDGSRTLESVVRMNNHAPMTVIPRSSRALATLLSTAALALTGCQESASWTPYTATTGATATTATAAPYPPMPDLSELDGPFPVARVVDGDTIVVENGGATTTVRLIGVDTPELLDPRKPVQCFSREASAYTKSLLTDQSVYLEYDPTQDRADRYGRDLAYVWTTAERLVNLDLIAGGFANEYTYRTPHRYQAVFRATENIAADESRGLWSPETCPT